MVRSVLAHHLHRRFRAPMRRTAGVHSVYLTACCAAGNSSVSITAFTFS